MKAIVPQRIELYAAGHSLRTGKVLNRLFQATHQSTQFPQMLVGPLEGTFLRIITRAIRAKRILEIGTFTGYSALAMAEALPRDGKLITCDINPKTTKLARKFWAESPHGRKIELQLAPALETIPKLKGLFDLVFIDADKINYWNYWQACLPKVRKGGILLVDNVLWSGRVLDPKDETDRALVQFNKKVAADRRVEVVMLSLRDGVTFAIKK